jgi:release factor glutamine methyltransferase
LRLNEALNYGEKKLYNYSNCPEYESMVLLQEVSGKSREEILINDESINRKIFDNFEKIINKRINGYPIQYITGKINFLGIEININHNTFIPRPETEYMTHLAINDCEIIHNPSILEIGTGSGAIAISLALNLPTSRIIATDISLDALYICKKNILIHNLEKKVFPICTDIIESIRSNSLFDMIISNPPYIAKDEFGSLSELVKKEPRIALDGGIYGAKLINQIIKISSTMLKRDGILYIELSKNNIKYLDIPNNLDYKVLKDQFNEKRVLKALKK